MMFFVFIQCQAKVKIYIDLPTTAPTLLYLLNKVNLKGTVIATIIATIIITSSFQEFIHIIITRLIFIFLSVSPGS